MNLWFGILRDNENENVLYDYMLIQEITIMIMPLIEYYPFFIPLKD